jgi:hypothetical protein
MNTRTRRATRFATAALAGGAALGAAGAVTASPASAGTVPTLSRASATAVRPVSTTVVQPGNFDVGEILTVGPVIPPGVICCGNQGVVVELGEQLAGPQGG